LSVLGFARKRDGAKGEVGTSEATGADETQRPFDAAGTGLHGISQHLQVGVLRLADKVDPRNFFTQELLETITGFEIDAQLRTGRGSRRSLHWLHRRLCGGPGRNGRQQHEAEKDTDGKRNEHGDVL
jgi:hypothetical protein